MRITVAIPAYNEAKRILPSLERIVAYMEKRHPGYDILVVDDGSTDDTAGVIERRFGPQVAVRSCGGNRGKGYAFRQAMREAQGDLVLFSDADLSTPIEALETMLPRIAAGDDIVIGSRAVLGAHIHRHQPWYREAAGKLFNLIVRLVVMGQFHDTQCGFKLFRREAVLPLLPHLQVDRWAFDVEVIAVAQAAGLRLSEVPVDWTNSPKSTVDLAGGLSAFLDLVRIRGRARRAGLDIAATRGPAGAVGGSR